MITLIKRAKNAGQIRNPAPEEILYDAMVYLMDGIGVIWAAENGSYDVLEESRKAFDALLMTNL